MQSEFDVASNCAFGKIRLVSRFVTNLYADALKEGGITPVQFSMMTAIKILDGANVNALSDAIKMDRTTINRNLKPLVRDGYVIVNESSDRRERIIALSEEGMAVFEQGYGRWKEAQRDLETLLGEETWEALHTLLDTVIRKIRTA